MKTAFITCLGAPIAIYEFGDVSNHALLLIHGNSLHSGFLIPMIRQLEKKYHILTLDLPGHNLSGAWEKEYFTRENLATLFNSVLDYFNVQEVNAFGFSMGGFILLECFELVPAIKKMAIAGHPPIQSAADMSEAYYINENSSLFLKGPLSDEEIERLFTFVIRTKQDYLKEEIKESIRKTSPSFREGSLSIAQHSRDQVSAINQLLSPIAIIHNTEDQAVRAEYMYKLQLKNLWEQKIQLIDECGHLSIVEKPEELAILLDRFYTESNPTTSYSLSSN